MGYSRIILMFMAFVSEVFVLENGLARTPPMGWMSWGYYMCNVNCDQTPEKCLNEDLILSVADAFFKEGYQEAGYEYIIIDDCWSEKERDYNGRLVPDRKRFPRGMQYIADYLHFRGLKFGMYTNVADVTCMLYPGSKSHFQIDAETFSEWGVDYIKVDGCFMAENALNTAYIEFGEYLNSRRPVVYSCSWPYYIQYIHNKTPDFNVISQHCNMWRNYHDVKSSWESVKDIMRHFESEYGTLHKYHGPGHWNDPDMPDFNVISQHCNMWRNYHDVKSSWESVKDIMRHFESEYGTLHKYHGPGHWNDPDMLIFGQGSLSPQQSRSHISFYAMLSAPLLLSCDMTNVLHYERKLLLNLNLIAVAQDPLGIMARPYKLQDKNISLWVKPHNPIKGDIYPSYSFLLLNPETDDTIVSFTPSEYGLNSTDGYTVMNVFTETFIQNITLNEELTVIVRKDDAVMYTLYPL